MSLSCPGHLILLATPGRASPCLCSPPRLRRFGGGHMGDTASYSFAKKNEAAEMKRFISNDHSRIFQGHQSPAPTAYADHAAHARHPCIPPVLHPSYMQDISLCAFNTRGLCICIPHVKPPCVEWLKCIHTCAREMRRYTPLEMMGVTSHTISNTSTHAPLYTFGSEVRPCVP